MIVWIVEINTTDFVGAGKEEDTLVADATATVLRQLHDVRTVAAERSIETQ